MKKRILSILCLVVALTAAPAWARVQKFDYFSLDVPRGWTAEQQGATVVVAAEDKPVSVSIAVAPMGAASLEELAYALSAQMDGTEPEFDDDVWTFTFTDLAGVESTAFLGEGDEEHYIVASVSGWDDAIEGILDSVEFYEE